MFRALDVGTRAADAGLQPQVQRQVQCADHQHLCRNVAAVRAAGEGNQHDRAVPEEAVSHPAEGTQHCHHRAVLRRPMDPLRPAAVLVLPKRHGKRQVA